jgi:zinc protease
MEYPASRATVDTLPSGLTILLDPDPAAPVVSVQCWVETGSIHEGDLAGSGISHFLEHMVFKGTRDHDADELAGVVQAAGGHWNAYTTHDRTVYYIDGPSGSLPVFLKCLTGIVFFPVLPESEFEREKDVIRREIDMGLDDPDNNLTHLLLSHAFRNDPRKHPVIGHRHRIDSLVHQDLLDYHARRYTADRCFLTVSGDFDPQEARELIESLTADCAKGPSPEVFIPADPPQTAPRLARDTFTIPASRILMAWKVPPLHDPASPALDLLAIILGQGRSSRLHRKLREETDLAVEISASHWTYPEREGLFLVSAETEPSKVALLTDAVHREMKRIETDELGPELAKAIRRIAAAQFSSLTTASGRATDLAGNWFEARDPDFTRNRLAALAAVTTDNIRSAARSLTPQTLTTAQLDPPDAELPGATARTRPKAEPIIVRTLSNGMTAALARDTRVPILHIQAAAKAGMPSETTETNGINQLLAATLPKGTLQRDAAQLALDLDSIGASLSASAGHNALVVQAGGLSADLAAIATTLAEVILQPALGATELEREKTSQLMALEESLQDPLQACLQGLGQLAFSTSGYGLSPLGSAESLARLDSAALNSHLLRHAKGSNMTIAAAGDIDPEQWFDLLESRFASLAAGEPWSAPEQQARSGGETTITLPRKQAVLAIGFPGASLSSADRHALTLIREYAADMAGPLFTNIRENLGLAYRVGASHFTGYHSGLFTFYLATSPHQLDQARRALETEIASIARDGVPLAAFERSRSSLLGALALARQSPASLARSISLNLLYGRPADEHLRVEAAYRALSPGEICDAAARIFGQVPLVSVALSSGTEAEPPAA